MANVGGWLSAPQPHPEGCGPPEDIWAERKIWGLSGGGGDDDDDLIRGGAVTHRAVTWLNAVAPGGIYTARSTSVLGLISAAKAGVGVAALPMALGDAEADLMRLFGPVAALTRDWRILAHPDQRKTPRIDAFFRFIVAEAEALRPILTG